MAIALPHAMAGPRAAGWSRHALAAGSGACLGVAFLVPVLFGLAWAALVGLALATRGADARGAYGLGLVFGVALLLVATPWVFDTLAGLGPLQAPLAFAAACAVWLSLAQLPALALAACAACRRGGLAWPLRFAVALSLAFSAAPPAASCHLAGTQTAWLPLIQGLAVTGATGLDFLMALTAATVAERLAGTPARRAEAVVAVLLAAWLGYGLLATARWEGLSASARQLPVGVVQPNEPPGASGEVPAGYTTTYPPELEMTAALAAGGARLVVLPEGTPKHLLRDPAVAASYERQARRLGAAIVLQDALPSAGAPGRQRNAAVLIGSDGALAGQRDKARLFPFRETLGPLEAFPVAREAAARGLGGLYQPVAAGRTLNPIEVRAGEAVIAVLPLICYETVFPRSVAAARAKTEEPTLIVGLVYDGWFGRTAQPWQHVRTGALRAVENRASVAYALNNGPSALYRPSGARALVTPIDEAGGYLAELPLIAADPTFYARYPAVPPLALGAAAVLMLGSSLLRARRR